jgi:asparagine synthase (glutamine-hydrolysing)
MCGIAGFISKKAPVPAMTLEAMTDSLAHRGPDDHGFFGWEADFQIHRWKERGAAYPLRVGLGSRRLAILDLSANGAQPMGTADDRYWLSFNGQIYNYLELRERLAGVAFRSQSDTEVLLQLFARYGSDCLTELNGMFAFAIFDRTKRELTLARDPLGIKPLYYFRDERGFFFASEIRALLAARAGNPTLRRELLARHFATNWLPDPDTLFEGIFRLEPGHCLVIDDRLEMRKSAFWDLRMRPQPQFPAEEWERALAAALRHAVARHLRSDVPVGFFLSGGIDSSLLTAQASRLESGNRTAFTIGFRWTNRSREAADIRYARMVALKYPLDHREIVLEPAIVSVLPKVIDALEEPLADPAAVCSYLICQAAAGQLKVLFSGQGADELFGGYPVYQAGFLAAAAQRLPGAVRATGAGLLARVPYRLAGLTVQTVHRLRKIAVAASLPWPQTFLSLRSPMRADEAIALLSPSLRDHQAPLFAVQEGLYANARDWNRFDQMMYLDAKTYLPALNLAYSDKTSMAHSVELRVPFLDREIVDLVERIPTEHKVNLREGKLVLKSVARSWLPPAVVSRPKAGFGLPLRQWFLDELQPMAADLLAPERLRRQGLLDPDLPSLWLREHREKRADHCMRLYSLMTFQLWLDRFRAS